MGKKGKARNQGRKRENSDAYLRMSFLYQAASLMSFNGDPVKENIYAKTQKTKSQDSLSRFYVDTMQSVARKSQIRM